MKKLSLLPLLLGLAACEKELVAPRSAAGDPTTMLAQDDMRALVLAELELQSGCFHRVFVQPTGGAEKLLRKFSLTADDVDPATIRVFVDGAPAEYDFNAAKAEISLSNAGTNLSSIDVVFCAIGGGDPDPDPSPTASPSVSPTPEPSASPTTSPTPEPSATPTPTPTPTPSPTPTWTPQPPTCSSPGLFHPENGSDPFPDKVASSKECKQRAANYLWYCQQVERANANLCCGRGIKSAVGVLSNSNKSDCELVCYCN